MMESASSVEEEKSSPYKEKEQTTAREDNEEGKDNKESMNVRASSLDPPSLLLSPLHLPPFNTPSPPLPPPPPPPSSISLIGIDSPPSPIQSLPSPRPSHTASGLSKPKTPLAAAHSIMKSPHTPLPLPPLAPLPPLPSQHKSRLISPVKHVITKALPLQQSKHHPIATIKSTSTIDIQPASLNGNESEEDSGLSSEGESSEDEEGEEEEEEDGTVISQPKSIPFTPFCPFPLLFCLTLVGFTFILASTLLFFGVASWGVREETLARYNLAVDHWNSRNYLQHMQQAKFFVVDLIQHQGDNTPTFNETIMLQPQSVNLQTNPSFITSTSSSSTSANSNTPTQNENGLNDQGSDVKVYQPLFYEVLIPSPISWDSSNDVDRYWSNLLNHDSRTLYIESYSNDHPNSIFNLTIPFLKKESKLHLTPTSCEATMSGMFDRTSKTCTFFSQLHSICIRVKMVGDETITPTSSSTTTSSTLTPTASPPSPHSLQWSLDEHEIGWELDPSHEEDPSAAPLTALIVHPPVHNSSASSTSSSSSSSSSSSQSRPSHPSPSSSHSDPSSLSGCIWDDISNTWSLGEYHAVDIRSEQFLQRTTVPRSINGDPNNPGGGDGSDEDDETTRAMKHAIELANQLRITIKSSYDPYVLAMDLTNNTLWFGLARTEKLLLSFVLGSVGFLFLIAPVTSLVQFLSLKSRNHFGRSRRARKGGYGHVAVSVGHASNPSSPSTHKLIPLNPSLTNGALHRFHECEDEIHSNSGSCMNSPSASVTDAEGFIPSEALRRSLVSSDSDPAIPNTKSPPTSSPKSPSSSSSSNHNQSMDEPAGNSCSNLMSNPNASPSKRIRIDPLPRYPDPIHRPATPTRQPRSAILSKKIRTFTHAQHQHHHNGHSHNGLGIHLPDSKRIRPKSDRNLTKILTGNFSFASLFSGWGGSNTHVPSSNSSSKKNRGKSVLVPQSLAYPLPPLSDSEWDDHHQSSHHSSPKVTEEESKEQSIQQLPQSNSNHKNMEVRLDLFHTEHPFSAISPTAELHRAMSLEMQKELRQKQLRQQQKQQQRKQKTNEANEEDDVEMQVLSPLSPISPLAPPPPAPIPSTTPWNSPPNSPDSTPK